MILEIIIWIACFFLFWLSQAFLKSIYDKYYLDEGTAPIWTLPWNQLFASYTAYLLLMTILGLNKVFSWMSIESSDGMFGYIFIYIIGFLLMTPFAAMMDPRRKNHWYIKETGGEEGFGFKFFTFILYCAGLVVFAIMHIYAIPYAAGNYAFSVYENMIYQENYFSVFAILAAMARIAGIFGLHILATALFFIIQHDIFIKKESSSTSSS